MNKWKLQVTCPNGHSDKITMYYTDYELRFACVKCDYGVWWEPTEKELKENGVTVS